MAHISRQCYKKEIKLYEISKETASFGQICFIFHLFIRLFLPDGNIFGANGQMIHNLAMKAQKDVV